MQNKIEKMETKIHDLTIKVADIRKLNELKEEEKELKKEIFDNSLIGKTINIFKRNNKKGKK